MRKVVASTGAALTLAAGLLAAQARYVRAEEDENHDLVITAAGGERSVVARRADEKQVAFGDIAISRDGTAVGWATYYHNCCTSYPVPVLLEVYKAGRRHTFVSAIAPWYWCVVDGSARVAAISSTVRGPENEVLELWDISRPGAETIAMWVGMAAVAGGYGGIAVVLRSMLGRLRGGNRGAATESGFGSSDAK